MLLDALAMLARRAVALPVRRQPRARPGIRRDAPSAGRRGWDGRPRALLRARSREPRSPTATAPPTCWCSPRAARPTGWSSPRPWHAACRSSPPRSAGCRRRWGTAPTAPGRACSSRPTIRPRSRRPPGLARGSRPAAAVAPRGARTARVALPLVDDDIGRGRRPRGGGAMSVDAIRVSRDWLDLRERADAAARSRELVAQLVAVSRRPWLIHDLACGSGSMGRWLAPLLPGPQHWVLHDRDADLLAARRRSTCPARHATALASASRPGCPTSRSSAATISPARRSSPRRRCSTC